MYIILSQKIDTESSYKDAVFEKYHYPSRYKNQIHEGDVFVYYQGNRYKKDQRYYFGYGTIKKIIVNSDEDYYAELSDCVRFVNNVPIYLEDGGYVESIGYESIRKSVSPPWQSSIRPLSEAAFNYIIKESGITKESNLDELKERLKWYVKSFYRDGNLESINEIEALSHEIRLLVEDQINKSKEASHFIQELKEYVQNTKITYSYKLVLLIAFIAKANDSGELTLDDATEFVRNYYNNRRRQGKTVEKKGSLYLDKTVTDKQIQFNLIHNPIKALDGSKFFNYDSESQILSMPGDMWRHIGPSEKTVLNQACISRLEEYYKG